MTKMKYYKQTEQMFVYEKQPLNMIRIKLNLSRRTLFYWKKKYNWDKKRFYTEHNKDRFCNELLDFTRKIMDKILNDIDNNQQTPQAEMYSLMNILTNIPLIKQHTNTLQSKQKPVNKGLTPDFVYQIEREILGMELSFKYLKYMTYQNNRNTKIFSQNMN